MGLGESEILTADPRNVEHILKTRFDNYTKEENNWENLGDLLGHGIFAVDGEKWRQQRKLASFEFSGRVLRDFSCSVFRMNVVKVVGFVSEFGLSAKSFDAQVSFRLCFSFDNPRVSLRPNRLVLWALSTGARQIRVRHEN